MDINKILGDIGTKASEYSTKILEKISETTGVESSSLSLKLLTILILSVGLYLVTKITNKMWKWASLILLLLLIISIGYTIFT